MKALLIAVSLATLGTAGAAYAAGTDQVLTSTGNAVSAAHWMPDNGPSLTTAQVKKELQSAATSGEIDYLNMTLYKGA
ncbi:MULTISPECIES: hypothetical protein [Pandoraea]|uniref:DUF4148 domain-containing protein n=1 Tax=Pandoraea capi TaxID=2508286 RepID=A0ABY6VRF4_9BURK|nr:MULTISPECIES: hypothetical protein [Pandoraea]MCI3207913.1 hypothetical protein [Pandoraea sp. LA3]MDN4585942.1 hypothetical protein [Pandoraea capi]ODP32998.1 hypothetical protein A9762_04860 [Pandoraea sp. ISTKB]VVD79444.1 hypothetical protein PCA20602_01036 [Pandoraea capi]